jgi:hypothetical protein
MQKTNPGDGKSMFRGKAGIYLKVHMASEYRREISTGIIIILYNLIFKILCMRLGDKMFRAEL